MNSLIWTRSEVAKILDISLSSVIKCEEDGIVLPAFRLPAGKMERVFYDLRRIAVMYLYTKLRTNKGYLEKKSFKPIAIVNGLAESLGDKFLDAEYLLIFKDNAEFSYNSNEFQKHCLNNQTLLKVIDWQELLSELRQIILIKIPDDRSASLNS